MRPARVAVLGAGAALLALAPPASATLQITFPSRAEPRAPLTATMTTIDKRGYGVLVPYVQASPLLHLQASVDPGGGAVSFTVHGPGGDRTVTANESGAADVLLQPGTFSVDATVVGPGGAVQTDHVDDVGIGLVAGVIGDSISDGYAGASFQAQAPIGSWLDAPTCSGSADGRETPQFSTSLQAYESSWLVDLAQTFAQDTGQPAYLANQAFVGYTSGAALAELDTANFKAAMAAARPASWLIELGGNDAFYGIAPATFKSNLRAIIARLESAYGAAPSAIVVAKPPYATAPAEFTARLQALQPVVDQIVAETGVRPGPDLWSYFSQRWAGNYFDNVHPNAAGEGAIARLWEQSLVAGDGAPSAPLLCGAPAAGGQGAAAQQPGASALATIETPTSQAPSARAAGGHGLGLLRASFHPRRVRVGKRTRIVVTVTSVATGRPVVGALVRLAGASARTDRHGRAIIRTTIARAGSYGLAVSKRGYQPLTS
jgi:lysophospholipase L1-like esterase